MCANDNKCLYCGKTVENIGKLRKTYEMFVNMRGPYEMFVNLWEPYEICGDLVVLAYDLPICQPL